MSERTQNRIIGVFVALFFVYLLAHVVAAVILGRLG